MTPGKKSNRPSKKRLPKTERRSRTKKRSSALEALPLPPLLDGIIIPSILLEGDNPPVPLKQKPKSAPAIVPVTEPKSVEHSLGSLPPTYDTKSLLLIAQDPHWLYAQWDFNRSDLIRYRQVASDGHLRLRLYKEEVVGHPMLEVVVGTEALHQFVPVAEAGVPYLATLGYYLCDGSWVTLCTSEKVVTPHSLPPVLNPVPALAPPPVAESTPKLESLQEDQIIPTELFPAPAIESEPLGDSAVPMETPLVPSQAVVQEEPIKLLEALEGPAEKPVPEKLEVTERFPPGPPVSSLAANIPELQPDEVKDQVDLPTFIEAEAKQELKETETPTLNGHPQPSNLSSRNSVEIPIAAAPETQLPQVEVIQQVLQKYLFDFINLPISSAERPSQPSAPMQVQERAWPPPEVMPIPEWFISGPLLSVSSLEAKAFQPQLKKEFWFQVNAELVIYGKTMSNAKVQIASHPIRLRSDGTFSYRFALPDGNYCLPIQATSADGTDTRLANLSFQRQSKYAGQVHAVPQDQALRPPRPELL